MKQRSTSFLRSVLFCLVAATLALCVFGLPSIANEAAEHFSTLIYLPAIIGAYLAAIPFFWAICQAFKLLNYFDKSSAFSRVSVEAIKHIKYSAAFMSLFFALGLPLVYKLADESDAPGVMVLGLIVTITPFVVSVFASILEKIFKNALELKAENDLTV